MMQPTMLPLGHACKPPPKLAQHSYCSNLSSCVRHDEQQCYWHIYDAVKVTHT